MTNPPHSLNPIARSVSRGMRWQIAAVIAGLAPCAPVLALPGDSVQVFVAETITHDSNVFRVAENETLPANASRDDTRTSTTAGVTLDVPVSLQRFQGEASFSRNDYADNDALDHTARDLRAAWLWQVGAALNGELGYTDAHRLSSLDDSGVNSDLLTIQRTYGNAAWMINPYWRLQAGLAEQTYEHDVRQAQDIEVNSTDMALTYISRAENTVGLVFRQDDVTYPHDAGNNGFQHASVGVQSDWSITDRSRINASIGWVEREFDQAVVKDYSGTVYRLAYEYQATDKLALTAVAQRDFLPSENISTRAILVESLAIRPRFRLTEKITLGGNVEYTTRDYVDSTSGRSDDVRSYAVQVTYEPIQTLVITLRVQHDERSSSVPSSAYSADVIGISARLAL